MDKKFGWYSIGVNIVLIAINLLIAFSSGSITIKAETAHNLLDLVASISVLIGVTISARKSPRFPYGLYKVENLAAVFISLAMFVTGYEIATEALFAPARQVNVQPLMLVGVAISGIIPLVFSVFELRAGRFLNSPVLIADAQEYRAHILSSLAVFAALAGQFIGAPVDRAAALLIVLWIGIAAWRMFIDAVRVLLDASIDAASLQKVKAIVLSNPYVVSIQSLTGRNSGRYRFVELEIILNQNDLERAHDIVSNIERKIKVEVPHVERVLVHFEPEKREMIRVAVPLTGRPRVVADLFGEAEEFGFFDFRTADFHLLRQDYQENPYADAAKGRGIQVAEWLAGKSVSVVVCKEDLSHKGSGFALSSEGVKVVQTGRTGVNEVLENLWMES